MADVDVAVKQRERSDKTSTICKIYTERLTNLVNKFIKLAAIVNFQCSVTMAAGRRRWRRS